MAAACSDDPGIPRGRRVRQERWRRRGRRKVGDVSGQNLPSLRAAKLFAIARSKLIIGDHQHVWKQACARFGPSLNPKKVELLAPTVSGNVTAAAIRVAHPKVCSADKLKCSPREVSAFSSRCAGGCYARNMGS
eukprot:3793874-Rhodomonas_salina.3